MALRTHVSSPDYWAVIEWATNTDAGQGDKYLIQDSLTRWDRKGVGYGKGNTSHMRNWVGDLKTITSTKKTQKGKKKPHQKKEKS